MAKKKTGPTKTLAEWAETVMRDALASCPALSKCGEKDYCEAVAEACDLIKSGAEMRLEELEGDEES